MTSQSKSSKPVTMAMISRLTGISQGAISSLLNNRDYGIRVSSETRQKVFATCREHGYIPNDLRALVRMYPDRGDLAVLWQPAAAHFLHRGFGPQFLKGLRSVLADQDEQITLADAPAEGRVLPRMLRDGIVSRIITVGHIDSDCREAILERDIRQVAVEDDPEVPGVSGICPEYGRAGFMALEHLYRLGHRNIAVITSGCAGFEVRERLLNAGVKEAAREFKLNIDRTIASQPDWQFENGSDISSRITGSPLQVTAAFCFRDEVAAGIIVGMLANGKKVPETLSIIGCGAEEASRYTYPGLTTVRVPAEELGRRAAEMVRQSTPGEDAPTTAWVPVELVVRETTAPFKS